MTLKETIELDVLNWIINYIEVDNKFYDYKFPVCPFAKSARLKGILKITAYESGNVKEFISTNARLIPNDTQHDICVMAMPPRFKWTWGIKSLVEQLNKELIPQGYFVQYGTGVKTNSKYPGLFNDGRYFMVFVNKLGPVMQGHEFLLKTDYYKPWSKEHYEAVVVRRQQLFKMYGNANSGENVSVTKNSKSR
jgi:hypothetical protein